MARTHVAAQTMLQAGYYPTLPLGAGAADVAWTNSSAGTSLAAAIIEAKTFILARNTDSATHTITIESVADQYGRTGDIAAYQIGPGVTSIFGCFRAAGWSNGGNLQIDTSDPSVEVAVLQSP